MEAVQTLVVNVELVEDHITRRAHLHGQIHSYVVETQVAGDVDGGSTALISLADQSKDLPLAELIRVRRVECLCDLRDLTSMHIWEEPTRIGEEMLLKWDAFLNLLLVSDRRHLSFFLKFKFKLINWE